MRVLLTGGAGFIGSHIADAYVAAGHEVMVVDDLSSGRRENLPSAVRLEAHDIRSPEAARAVSAFRPDVIGHHAAQMDVRKSVEDPAFDADVNVLGLLRILEAGRKSGLKRVVFSSSGGAAYGEQEVFPAAESHPTHPLSPYGVSKRAGELYLRYFSKTYGVHAVSLRYANVYGPRQNPHGEAGVVAIFSKRALRKEKCAIYGDGLQTRDFVFVADVVAANVAALTTSFQGEVNIATGRETNVVELYAAVAKAAGFAQGPVHEPGKLGEQRRSVLDASLAKRVLGWEPRTSLADGVSSTVAWFKNFLEKSS